MTPFQTYGQAAPPSNMMFPTAAYLQASQNAAEMQMRGQEALGKGIAGGISSIGKAYNEYKDDQSKFDATKKMYSAFKGFLPESSRNEIEKMFSDTSMSVREKNKISPLLMNMIAQGQQQQGRESVAKIMHPTPKQPRPVPRFDATNTIDQFGLPAGSSPSDFQALQPQSQVGGASDVPYMIQRQPDQPQPTKGPLSNMPKTRQDPETHRMQFWSPGAKRYVDESEDDLLFGPDFRITPY